MTAKRRTLIRFEITEASSADLRGRQSVRTTFKLTERAISGLGVLATQLGIKQKSLFDHLMEDVAALKHIANEFEDFDSRELRVAKTYVISRKTLENLERISLQYDTPRDALVEFSIARIMPLLERERVRHEKRKDVEIQIQRFLKEGLVLMNEVEETLGEDDPVFSEILTMMRGVKNCNENIGELIQRGKKIEDF